MNHNIEQRIGKITPYLEIVLDNGKLLLNTSKVNYSYGSLERIFARTFDHLNLQERKIKNVLILGFGGGCVAKLLTEKFSINCRITGIEADEVVIDLAKKYFGTDHMKNVTIHNADAYDFVSECKEKYDLIAIDIFVDDYTPLLFSGKKFLAMVDNLLTPSGIVCFNRMVNTQRGLKQAKDLIENFNETIGLSVLFDLKKFGYNNWMIIHDRTSLVISPVFEQVKKAQGGQKFKLNDAIS